MGNAAFGEKPCRVDALFGAIRSSLLGVLLLLLFLLPLGVLRSGRTSRYGWCSSGDESNGLGFGLGLEVEKGGGGCAWMEEDFDWD